MHNPFIQNAQGGGTGGGITSESDPKYAADKSKIAFKTDLEDFLTEDQIATQIENAIETIVLPPDLTERVESLESAAPTDHAERITALEAVAHEDVPPDLTGYATEEYVDGAISEIEFPAVPPAPDLSPITDRLEALESIEPPAPPDLSPYALTADVPEIVEAELANMEIDVPQALLDRVTALETALANVGSGGGGGGSEPDFSLEEVDTGMKWVDGKTVYRICFSTTTGGATSVVIGNIGAIENCIQINACATMFNAFVNLGKFYVNADPAQYAYVSVHKITGDVTLLNTNVSVLRNVPLNVTIYYTRP